MAEAAKTPGAMTAVKDDPRKLQPLLDKWGVPVVIANHNSPTQAVLSGTTTDIERVEDLLLKEGKTFQRLKVATAFHSAVVSDASLTTAE